MENNEHRITVIIPEILNELECKHAYLLLHNVNERSIAHHLAIILSNYFPDYDVDCEYNRLDDKIKAISSPSDNVGWKDTDAKSVFPDIIVHSRGNQKKNLLVIELKKSSNTSSLDFDLLKLNSYKEQLNYKYAFSIVLGVGKEIGMNRILQV